MYPQQDLGRIWVPVNLVRNLRHGLLDRFLVWVSSKSKPSLCSHMSTSCKSCSMFSGMAGDPSAGACDVVAWQITAAGAASATNAANAAFADCTCVTSVSSATRVYSLAQPLKDQAATLLVGGKAASWAVKNLSGQKWAVPNRPWAAPNRPEPFQTVPGRSEPFPSRFEPFRAVANRSGRFGTVWNS